MPQIEMTQWVELVKELRRQFRYVDESATTKDIYFKVSQNCLTHPEFKILTKLQRNYEFILTIFVDNQGDLKAHIEF